MAEKSAHPIAALHGAESAEIQRLLAQCAELWRERVKVVGVIEVPQDCSACMPGRLLNLADGSLRPIFQDLGPGAAGCLLDAGALVAAGERVRRDIAAGCDFVILSKFGKLEAEEGSGFRAAFSDAIEAGVPVLTSVSPRFMAAWEGFAAPFFEMLPAGDPGALAHWCAASLPSR